MVNYPPQNTALPRSCLGFGLGEFEAAPFEVLRHKVSMGIDKPISGDVNFTSLGNDLDGDINDSEDIYCEPEGRDGIHREVSEDEQTEEMYNAAVSHGRITVPAVRVLPC